MADDGIHEIRLNGKQLVFLFMAATVVAVVVFLFGVMVAAWYGGLGPGLFVAVAGLLLGGYFFLPRTGSTVVMGDAERTTILVYVINATLVSFLMDNLHARIKKFTVDKTKSNPPQADAER